MRRLIMVHSPVMNWVIGAALAVIVGYLLEREIYFYEGVHFGPRLQAWLYDRWSKSYDEGKRASQLRDEEILAQPLLEALGGASEPLVLDFATGTGRLSYALLNAAEFKGRIIALDLSPGMLGQAASKLRARAEQIDFLRHPSLPLPFPDDTFDAVCALEVLELFPNMDEPIQELTRVLRPGGALLTSRGTEESGRRAKVKSAEAFRTLLETHRMNQVQITKWWKLFDCVIARKQGKFTPGRRKGLAEILKCSSCGNIRWLRTAGAWQCEHCGRDLPVTAQQIVLN